MKSRNLTPILQALLAAALFGASAPLSKLLLGEIMPIQLSAFLYLGSGIIILVVIFLRQMNNRSLQHREAPLRGTDLPWLAGAVLAGGVAAPIILMYSLQTTPAATASLLLNFEGIATALIAVFIFKEALNRLAWGAVILIAIASILLTLNTDGARGISIGALGVLGAAALWGLDNNLTRNISNKDPLAIVATKGITAGIVSLLLAIAVESQFPEPKAALQAMLLGVFSYGLSIVLFVLALRQAGTARTSALFSTAPLAGVILSLAIFQEPPPLSFWIALPLMALGTILLLREQHQHIHIHERLVHEHAHDHAELHHNHNHEPSVAGVHSHLHTHDEIEHTHEHLPDIHHRHSHQ
jgi:drug/metabolite transporter (DMT)-like permease